MDGPLTRYIALQVPGATIAGLALLSLWATDLIGPATAWGVFVLWILKDAALYPFVRNAYVVGVPTGGAELIGSIGEACGEISPRGQVRVRGETWRAEALPGEAPIHAGAAVRVEGAERLLLKVRRVPAPGREGDPKSERRA